MKKSPLKSIKAINAKNKRLVSKALLIPFGFLILLHDHPEPQNKIQDNNKDQLFIVTGHHQYRNANFVKPLGSKEPPKQVNHHHMYELGITEEQEQERQYRQEEEHEKDKVANVPLYQPSIAHKQDKIEI